MAKLIMYLLESSALLAFFYLLYVLVLSKETFFSLNRFFLLGILAFSLLFPLVSFDISPTEVAALERPIAEISKARMSYYETMAAWEFEAGSAVGSTQTAAEPGVVAGAGVDWLRLAIGGILLLYAIGVVVCLSRTFWSLRWIWKVIAHHPHENLGGMKVVKLPQPISPFSFLNYVFVPDSRVDSSEFHQILAHEKTHIDQRHSVDLLIVQLLAAFLWFNPVIWQLIKSLKTTHEYIADKKIITSGYSLVEYQTLLLKQLISNNSFGLVHNFNLSFIKKRITMMTNQKSGWSGKVRVAMALVGAVVFSAIVVQCNSKMDESVAESGLSAETSADFTAGINLPVLFDNGYTFDGNRSDVLNFTIADNKLSIDGKASTVSDIASVISGAKLSDHGAIIMRVDKDQPMGFVRDVQMELRKADRRKIVHMGQTVSGKSFEMPLLLPPVEGRPMADGKYPPTIDEQYAAEHDIDILKIQLGDNAGAANQQLVYDFVMDQMRRGKSNYVVSAKCNDDDTYSDYMVNLAYIQGGFDQIYQERSHQMFGKDFYDLEYGKNEYKSVRQGIPKAISVAER
ncbi:MULTISPECIES: M56 family metallopeptidase [unclassified Imperialibacter]|uniref:M56 family metallopeptidase n=1 Tax=unclassified Imperialibacter TaxID=2629706 RepID=UPI0012585DF3|nr:MULTISPECIES: M56 family metallopeptidase [unclassified Imperialibacter]CAD5282032.1 BlaR1 peptidase M56 [Imperialibacter sp. 89]CAD5287548.1 BlaR1 peptidase M56 [Imperialibacter sp. 75]VVT30789.1 BlaR1 peptidase M56 [Imperialibacter sp. EC-SDR9]